ncbi:hypothetical protein GOP47_0018353 [Adiantum capillus-veneris]|uniref:Uncharacterized protein n=1 Tax=Adiantum capillus-veneris TaxID=13818 RepID=A0A9D4ZBT0_ADICA|nr:hypothetical protein GOP47_0018353 [Adiantum capillus-veneris]
MPSYGVCVYNHRVISTLFKPAVAAFACSFTTKDFSLYSKILLAAPDSAAPKSSQGRQGRLHVRGGSGVGRGPGLWALKPLDVHGWRVQEREGDARDSRPIWWSMREQ